MNQITNFLRISDTLLTGGQPRRDQFAMIGEAEVKNVINLALPTSENALPDEGKLVTSLGMNYIHIPVDFREPQSRDLLRFFKAMEMTLGEKTFVHCALDYRVSAFIFLYRLNILHEDEDNTRNDLLEIWLPDPTWEMFIEDNLERNP